jgi:hypothetical protein
VVDDDRDSRRASLIQVAFSLWLYLIKFCTSFSHLSSPSISITDTVSYLISYLPPLYFHAYGRLSRCICIGSHVTPDRPDPRTPLCFFSRSSTAFENKRPHAPSVFSHLYTLDVPTTFDGRPIRKHEWQ